MLTPDIQQLCRKCSADEGRGILAYCCYVASLDKTLQRHEVSLVRQLADEFGIPQAEVANLAHKVRLKRIRIGVPKTEPAKLLMFRLALRMAMADAQFVDEERVAISKLAQKLDLTPQLVNAELTTALAAPGTQASEVQRPEPNSVGESAQPQPPPVRSFLGWLTEPFSVSGMEQDLEAELLPADTEVTLRGELEYSLGHSLGHNCTVIELQLDGTSTVPLSVWISGLKVCDVPPFGAGVAHKLTSDTSPLLPKVIQGDNAEIRQGDTVVLKGTFRQRV